MGSGKELFLSARRVELQGGSIDMCVVVELGRVRLILRRILVSRAFYFQLQHQGIVVGWVASVGILFRSLLEGLQPVETLHAAFQWNQA